MMKEIKWLLAFLVCISTGMKAQNVVVKAEIDSLQIMIGDQTKLSLEVALDADRKVVMPHLLDTIVKGVEIVEPVKQDTQYLNNRQRMLISQEYLVTSFDSALYYLPPMEVMVDSQKYNSNSLALKVYSFPVDTLNPEQYFGTKAIMKTPFVWSDWAGTISFVILLFPVGFLLFYLVVRLMDNKPIIRKVKIEPKLPPYEVAMKKIDRIKVERIWQKGELKEYYTALIDALREYIGGRFGFNATEMTSSEIVERLSDIKETKQLKELKELLETADLVKFAKYVPELNENDSNLVIALDYINENKTVETEPKESEPQEITIVEKRTLKTKILLGISVTLLVVATVAMLVYVVTQVYNLLA